MREEGASMSGWSNRGERWRGVGPVTLALLALGFAPAGARADANGVVGSWQCVAEPDPSVPAGSETFLVTFDLGRTVVTANGFGRSFPGAGAWQRTGPRRFAAREVVNGVALAGESEYRLERAGALSFERVLSPLDPDAPFPPLRMVGTCRRLPLSARSPEGDAR
jgi:hypothetical protein